MTIPHGPEFYDDDTIFSVYQSHRQRTDSANDTLEGPVIFELAGALTGQRILDLGCGEAGFGLEALRQNCASYLGLDGSRNMVAAAQQALAGTRGAVEHATLEAWDYPAHAFDLIVSRLVFHYVADLASLFSRLHRALAANGRLVFSVEHPVITACDLAWQGVGQRQAWLVDNYFHPGARRVAWLGGQVVKYHRTVEHYFTGLQQAGFVVEALREAEPVRERFTDEALFHRRQRIPLFLIIAAHKSSARHTP
jgi:cyclopropane fatty-acyl-phospholipid synthase-like methyltransferase